jgi:hypothetical protein
MISVTSLLIAFNPDVNIPVTTCPKLRAWGLYPSGDLNPPAQTANGSRKLRSSWRRRCRIGAD